MAKRTILVVEDDDAIRQGLIDTLEIAGYATLAAERGDRALEMALMSEYDLLLLDLMLPGLDGLALLQQLHEKLPTVPVIILTARGDVRDRLTGLRRGADDYVVKPFSMQELLARVAAVLRRSPERPLPVEQLTIPAGTVDLVRAEVRFSDGSCSELSERECALLRYLAANAGRAIARDEILARVWRVDPHGIETRTIDMHVARLRGKLRDDGPLAQVIVTVRGRGYKLGLPEPAS